MNITNILLGLVIIILTYNIYNYGLKIETMKNIEKKTTYTCNYEQSNSADNLGCGFSRYSINSNGIMTPDLNNCISESNNNCKDVKKKTHENDINVLNLKTKKKSIYNFGEPGTPINLANQVACFKLNYRSRPSITGMFTDTAPYESNKC